MRVVIGKTTYSVRFTHQNEESGIDVKPRFTECKITVDSEQFIKQKEQEFQKAKDEKTKEFTKEANELIGIVSSIGILQQQYLKSLTSTN